MLVFDQMMASAEEILQGLELHYRNVLLVTGDMSFTAARTIDIEAWLPGQGKYRETHTADYMTDYQARRLRTRVKRADGQIELVHTNDATAFALSRTPIAIIENYQTTSGDVVVPEALRSYLGGREII